MNLTALDLGQDGRNGMGSRSSGFGGSTAIAHINACPQFSGHSPSSARRDAIAVTQIPLEARHTAANVFESFAKAEPGVSLL